MHFTSFRVPKTWEPYNSAKSGWPRRANSYMKTDDFGDAESRRLFASLSDVGDFRPYLHTRIPRITVVEQLPQITVLRFRVATSI